MDAGETVEQDALLAFVKAGERFSLRMNQSEFGGELFEHGYRGGLVVDEDAALAVGQNFAAQNNVGAFGVDAILFKDGLGAGRGLEDAGNDSLFGSVSNNVGRGFATHQQRQCIYKNRFARASFARKQIQARAEGGNGVIDDGVIFSAEFDESVDGRVIRGLP